MTGTINKSCKPRRWTTLALTTTALVGLAIPTGAAAQEWTGAVSPDWFDPANWTTGVPMAGDQAVISITTNPTTIDTGAAATQVTVVGGLGNAALHIINGG